MPPANGVMPAIFIVSPDSSVTSLEIVPVKAVMSAGSETETPLSNASVPVKPSRLSNANDPPPVESVSVTLPVPWNAPEAKTTACPLASIVVLPQNQTGVAASESTTSNVPSMT